MNNMLFIGWKARTNEVFSKYFSKGRTFLFIFLILSFMLFQHTNSRKITNVLNQKTKLSTSVELGKQLMTIPMKTVTGIAIIFCCWWYCGIASGEYEDDNHNDGNDDFGVHEDDRGGNDKMTRMLLIMMIMVMMMMMMMRMMMMMITMMTMMKHLWE